ncbi:macro domain-containing protein [Herpetosiphon geysericola]|uniref:Appr-1-p processing domain-containing protein n=1 Tax=Herpetosiphon geysericola TaxID=70996 RepID=A0A0P6YKS5_9CHLR|nr:macro domain-containing protein [Herpetosiphon geysericola]KPL90411.1 appr-1-p processing domain-containing protein [Herpetosiphon geysericola]
MLEYCQGNLLAAKTAALVNPVNCVGLMGKGLALQFRQAFPANYQAYVNACRAGVVKLGSMFVFIESSAEQPITIINFPTKQHWKQQSRLADIASGLDALITVVAAYSLDSLAVPALGCGYGGLAWADVEPLIIKAFERVPNVHVQLYPPQ